NSDKTEVFLQKKMRACIGSVAIYVPLSHTCQMAARAGIVEAQVALAKIYSYKPDSEENMQQALYWARAAAMQQDAEGQFLLADILAMQERQSGGTVDHVTERYAWYTIAAEKKELSLFKRLAAKNHAKKLWAEMTEGQREKAVALAQTYAAQSFMQAE
ncbi:MAG TPA: hypothetical protein VHP34_00580, partial [Alphaproteobacteria bacterium]|nr:hypothetical protein [Alphaproteobacteria bacterium]